MPRAADAELRAMIAAEDRSQLQLEQSPWNKTGFVGVIQVGNKYYARLQVPGDGRGGVKSAGKFLCLARGTRRRMQPWSGP